MNPSTPILVCVFTHLLLISIGFETDNKYNNCINDTYTHHNFMSNPADAQHPDNWYKLARSSSYKVSIGTAALYTIRQSTNKRLKSDKMVMCYTTVTVICSRTKSWSTYTKISLRYMQEGGNMENTWCVLRLL